jgi:hypothetical protein
MSAIRAVQTAIYGVLSADATLAGLSLTAGTATVGVFNDVPDGQDYPHVLISKARERAWHTLGGRTAGIGWDVMVPIFVMSRYSGDREALQILERIVALLNFSSLAVTGFTSVICEYAPGGDMTGQVMVIDVDKIETRQVVAEFQVLVRT